MNIINQKNMLDQFRLLSQSLTLENPLIHRACLWLVAFTIIGSFAILVKTWEESYAPQMYADEITKQRKSTETKLRQIEENRLNRIR